MCWNQTSKLAEKLQAADREGRDQTGDAGKSKGGKRGGGSSGRSLTMAARMRLLLSLPASIPHRRKLQRIVEEEESLDSSSGRPGGWVRACEMKKMLPF